jgi:hypothetical protein
MKSLQDALLKANLISEKQAEDAHKKINENQEKEFFKNSARNRRAVEQENSEQTVNRNQRVVGKEYDKFEEIWENNKSRQFMIHLLHGFLPFPDSHFIWEWNQKPHWKNGKKCCICQIETLAKQDLFEHLKELTDMSLKSLLKEVKDEKFNRAEFMTAEKKKILGDRIMGVTSEKTSCIMCNECFELFSKWVPTKMLLSDSFAKAVHHVMMTAISKLKNAETQTPA